MIGRETEKRSDGVDAVAFLERVRDGEAELPAPALRALVHAYLDLREGLEHAPHPTDVDGGYMPRSPYAGWHRDIRAARLERTAPQHVLDPAAPAVFADPQLEQARAAELDRQAARALIAAFDRPAPGAPPVALHTARPGGSRRR